MHYKNPVIRGFYPDPSVCEANGTYYLAASSFQYFPGVPLFESTDFINWNPIGHVLTRPSQVMLDKVRSSGGVFAPTLRYHEGRFYMVTNNNSTMKNFYVYTDDVYGEWSDPIEVDQGGIDPSLYFEDGHTYFISNGQDENGTNGIIQCEINIETGERLTKSTCIWTGAGGRYIESPHMYKIGSYYYLLVAEGGTEYGHMASYARSTSVWGPFEGYAKNPVLTNRNKAPYIIQGIGHGDLIQATSGDWFLLSLGFRQIHIWQPYHHLGREVFLTPVQFDENGWFTAGLDGTTDEEYNIPDTVVCSHDFSPAEYIDSTVHSHNSTSAAYVDSTAHSHDSTSAAYVDSTVHSHDSTSAAYVDSTAGRHDPSSDGRTCQSPNQKLVQCRKNLYTFENTDWKIDWCYLRKMRPENYQLSEHKAVLTGCELTLEDVDSPTFLGIRQMDFDMELSCDVTLTRTPVADPGKSFTNSLNVDGNPASIQAGPVIDNTCASYPDAAAGLTVFMSETEHYDILIRPRPRNDKLQTTIQHSPVLTNNDTDTNMEYEAVLRLNIGDIKHEQTVLPINTNTCRLFIRSDSMTYHFLLQTEQGEQKLGSAGSKYLSSEVSGGFTGVVLGLFAEGDCQAEFTDYRCEYQ